MREIQPLAFLLSPRPETLVFAPAVDIQVPRHAEDPRPNVFYPQAVAQRAVKAEEYLLGDFLSQWNLASNGAQITEDRFAQFAKPTFDFFPVAI